MSTTINLSVDLTELKPSQVTALSNFISSFTLGLPSIGGEPTIVKIGSPETEKPAKERKPRGSKAQAGAFEGQERTSSHVDNYEAAKELEVKEAETVAESEDIMGEPTESKKSLTLDDLRAISSEKINDLKNGPANKDTLKAELTRLGLGKLADLKPEQYQAFYDFTAKL